MALIHSGDTAVEFTSSLQFTAFGNNEKRFPVGYSSIEFAGSIVEPHELEQIRETEWRITPEVSAGGSVRLEAVADGVSLRCTPNESEHTVRFTVTVALPDTAKFHLPDGFSLVRLFDADMPIGRSHTCKRGLDLCVVEVDGMALAIRSEEGTGPERLGQMARTVARTPAGFLLSVSVPTSHQMVISTHAQTADAGEWFTDWMDSAVGARPRTKREASPDWIDDVQLVITVDMLRSTAEIAHDYGDLADLAGELATAGCPKDTLFYIPGWNGAYDAAYPDYVPRDELGGEAEFGRMMDAVHKHGYRVMIHTNPDGLDPYHRDIDDLIKYALKDSKGRYAGFQTPSETKMGMWGPPFRTLPYSSGRQPIRLVGRPGDLSFATVDVPQTCEACLTLGGLRGVRERVAVVHQERIMRSPAGWFDSNDEYRFPFAFRLGPGENTIALDEPRELPEGAWYRIHDCRVPPHEAALWTYPILNADVSNDDWISLVVGNIEKCVKRFEIDAVHCDAADFEPGKRFFKRLRDRLPGTAIGCEWFSTLSGYGFFDLSQGWRIQSLVAHNDSFEKATDYHELVPDGSKLQEALPWLDKASPLTGLTDRFTRVYPHLCHADGFVPVGKVCNCSPPALHPFGNARLRRLLDDAPRLGYIPGLRVNYREYGLDAGTAGYVGELGRS